MHKGTIYPRIADDDAGVQRADVDARFQGAGGADTEQFAGEELPLDLAADPIRVACATRPAATSAADLRPIARETAELPGPITDAYAGPLMLVVAGAGDSAACAKSAERISNRWAKWHHDKLDPLVEGKTDTKELADHNVILVGTWSR